MTTKQQVLLCLEQNKGNVISGQDLANTLGISRAAISKAVALLRSEGHNIHSATNKGYLLDNSSDIISAENISAYLPQFLADKVTVLQQTESTNALAKAAALNGCVAATSFVANSQTAGKGRRGKQFFSPEGGLYISLVLRPQLSAENSVNITTCAAVAVCRAIKTVCDKQTQIKWVNDIFYNNKKVCGILTEAASDLESGGLEYAVVGIGINFQHPQNNFPQDIQNIATALYNENPGKNLRAKLAAQILQNLWQLLQNPNSPEILNEYKKLSFILGKRITVLCTPPRVATAIDINDKGNLVVKYENGETGCICSGEVSILPTISQ